MKKTLTINLNGIVFNIDEDAYQMLNDYLDSLRHVFQHEEESEEIVSDIEGRICELLAEDIQNERQVVSINHIEDIITRMGKPEEYDEFDAESTEEATHNSTPPPFIEPMPKPHRKLFKDPDTKMIGGVCAGIAAYLNVDVTWVRLICVGLCFLTLTFCVCAYIVLWIVVPEAKTASDRLAMMGEEPTLENIGKTVKDSYDKVSDKARPYIQQAKDGSWGKRLANGIVNFFSFIAKMIVVGLAVIAVPVVIAFALALIILIILILTELIGCTIDCDWTPLIQVGSTPIGWDAETFWGMTCGIGAILMVGIPLIALIYSVFKSMNRLNPMGKGLKYTLISLWFIGVIVMTLSIVMLNNIIN